MKVLFKIKLNSEGKFHKPVDQKKYPSYSIALIGAILVILTCFLFKGSINVNVPIVGDNSDNITINIRMETAVATPSTDEATAITND